MLVGETDNRDALIAELQDKNHDLGDEVASLRREIEHAKRENARAVGSLRKQLSPLYHALRAVFGELDALGASDEPGAAPSNPRWNSLKQRMPGRPAEMIDLLLAHDSLSVRNLMALMHCGKDAVYQAASKLGQAGAITNNGGRYSLKDR